MEQANPPQILTPAHRGPKEHLNVRILLSRYKGINKGVFQKALTVRSLCLCFAQILENNPNPKPHTLNPENNQFNPNPNPASNCSARIVSQSA